MSSDSELDEFFDAEESTPRKTTLPSGMSGIPEDSFGMSELEAEERRLLELKKKQEERRLKEDEEYMKRLDMLRKKKEEKHVVIDSKIKENEKRRKRLEDLRQRMTEDTDGIVSTGMEDLKLYHDSDTDDEMLNTPADEDSDSSNGKPPSFKVTKEPESSNRLSTQESEILNRKSHDYSDNITTSFPEKEKPNKQIPHIQVTEERLTDNCGTGSGEIVDELLGDDKNEPDIVRSTKTRTPPTTLVEGDLPEQPRSTVIEQPRAPPRKKKKGERSSGELSQTGASDWSSGPQGLSLPTPTSTVDNLTKELELEYALDLHSALGGARHINAEDAERDAVNSDHDSPRQKCDSLPSSVDGDPSGTDKGDVESGARLRSQGHSSGAEETLRPRSNSGRLLSDKEILQAIRVLNLDTGESVPLSIAEEKIPKGLNPLDLHLIKRTKEYHSDGSLKDDHHHDQLDNEDTQSLSEQPGAKKKASRLRKIIGRKVGKTMSKVKTMADTVLHSDDVAVEEEVSVDGKIFKIKASNNNKGPYDFKQLRMLQDLSGTHSGAIWTMKFSPCGRLLATGGQDSMLRIWVIKSASSYFDDMRQKYADVRVSPAPSQESLNSATSENSASDLLASGSTEEELAPFMSKPFCTYRGHSADLLDVSWSKNYFILSSSMDKTVRLWHISRRECLCTFQHIDFVTAIVFHPRDDRYFLSGSLDGKLRLWNIPEKKVTMWNEAQNCLITTANFCHNGKFAVAGTYDGKCIFYNTEQLKYYTQIHVRSTRGKNARGRKITGIEPLPGEDKVLVTSNDSRIRMYDLRDLTLTCKYKGGANNSSQIKASFSPKCRYIVCGSEDHFVYIWKTQHEYYKFSSARRDRNDYWEALKVHNAVVTAAVFAPNPSLLMAPSQSAAKDDERTNQVLVTADFSGAIKVVQNTSATTQPSC
ncbi:WD repeat-containing protein 44-like isoform X2 [Pecten maximus]|uniref:WD repeat-containing protein 44-like isoform X2 n=1 Tax=Pecten maximus TaxID=6579 RepID=UPI001458383C|nr:WD repeat-containing protein 44-like isoform X2 [Pecten maximus]